MTKAFKVLGDPISHSLSPTIHAAAYQALGLDWTYSAERVSLGSLEEVLLKTTSAGFSITMPLKYEAATMADVRDPLVSLTGVANTLIKDDNGWSAYNTDIFGITKALQEVLKSKIEVVAILGAGATAKSALVAIAKAKPNTLFDIYVRDEKRANDLLELAGELDAFTAVHSLGEFSNFQHLTINTLPLGASDQLPIQTQAGYLLNANYAGGDNSLVSSFSKDRVTSGQTMLVWQALQQIRLFSGLNLDQSLPNERQVVEAMFAAL
jgi:shikimate dehydrogenase